MQQQKWGFCDTVLARPFKLCMMIACIELYPYCQFGDLKHVKVAGEQKEQKNLFPHFESMCQLSIILFLLFTCTCTVHMFHLHSFQLCDCMHFWAHTLKKFPKMYIPIYDDLINQNGSVKNFDQAHCTLRTTVLFQSVFATRQYTQSLFYRTSVKYIHLR